jgi:hypothetical protein
VGVGDDEHPPHLDSFYITFGVIFSLQLQACFLFCLTLLFRKWKKKLLLV